MSEQQDNPKRSVAVPVVVALVALALFGYAFYALDGMALVQDLLGTTVEGQTDPQDPVVPDTEPEGELQLPEGMDEEFALRIWQEQLDSQANIVRLVNDEVARIVIDDVVQDGDEATLSIVVEFRDGTTAPGRLGMRRFDDTWYFAYVSGMRPEDTGGYADGVSAGPGESPTSTLPPVEDVDVALLNTILEQQASSAAVLDEYAAGTIQDVAIEKVTENTGTRTLRIKMNEDHEQGYGEIVVVSKMIDGDETWFIAKFTKEAAE